MPCRLLMTFLLLIAFSASYGQVQPSSSFHLQYAFHQGDQYQMKQHSQEDTYLDLNGEEQRTTNARDVTLLLTISGVKNDQAILQASYTQISINSSSSGQQVSVNT